MVICVFGDSIVWGARDKELGGWVNRLRLSLENKLEDVEVYNLGVSGDTSEDLLNRFESEAAVRRSGEGQGGIALVSIGVNDSATDEEGNFFISPTKYEENIRTIAEKAKELGYALVFVGLGNVDESKTNPVTWANVYYSEEDLDQYSKIAEGVATETGSYFLSIGGLFGVEDLEDGLHPNSAGHAKIAGVVENFLITNKLINT